MATFGGIGRTGIADVRTVDTSDARNRDRAGAAACHATRAAATSGRSCSDGRTVFLTVRPRAQAAMDAGIEGDVQLTACGASRRHLRPDQMSPSRSTPTPMRAGLTAMVLWRRRNLHPPSGGSGTGSRLLHYFSMNRVDSRGLRWIPVDSTAANKRLTSNVLDHKLRIVSQLQKHARTGSTPAA